MEKYKDISEVQLMIKYLENRGSNVMDVVYYHEGALVTVDTTVTDIGSIEGRAVKDVWFFGNVNINATISGAVVLTNQNLLILQFMSILKGRSEVGYYIKTMGVDCGMALLGNGEYEGSARLYGMGFNRVVTNTGGFGAATFAVRYCFNGYLFIMR